MAFDVVCCAELVVIFELLCYLVKNFSKASVNGLATTISGFFSWEDIELEKNKLLDILRKT